MITNYKNFLLILSLIFILSCGGFSEAGKVLRNEKTKTTDEFLVKKRAPLTLPPEYDTIPAPLSIEDQKKKEDKGINKILQIPRDEKTNNTNNTSVEQSILNQIKK